MCGLLAVLWLPRAVERLRPRDRATNAWADRLLSGERMIVDIGDLPDNAKGKRPRCLSGQTAAWRTGNPRSPVRLGRLDAFQKRRRGS